MISTTLAEADLRRLNADSRPGEGVRDVSFSMIGLRSGREEEVREGVMWRAKVRARGRVRVRMLAMGGGGGEVMERYWGIDQLVRDSLIAHGVVSLSGMALWVISSATLYDKQMLGTCPVHDDGPRSTARFAQAGTEQVVHGGDERPEREARPEGVEAYGE